MHQILFLTLPSTIFLIVLRIPVVRLTFGAAQFNWSDTVLTGRTLAFLAMGLAAQSVVLLFVRAFYALKDTKTPVLVSLLTVSINIILSIIFVKVLKLDVWSLGISYSAASDMSLFILFYFLDKKVGGFRAEDVYMPALKMILAALVAALALYIPVKALDQVIFDTTRTVNLIFLTAIASVFGIGIYLLLVWLLRVKELYVFGNMFKKLYRMQFQVKTEEIIKETNPL